MSNNVFKKNVYLTIIRQGITLLLGFVLTIIIARSLGSEGQGLYTLTLLLPSLLFTFINAGIGVSTVYYSNDKSINIKEIILSNILIALFLSGVAIILGVILILLFSDKFFNGIPIYILLTILIVIPFLFLNAFLQTVFQGKQDFKSYNSTMILGQFTNLIMVIFIGLTNNFSLFSIVMSYISSQIFITIVIFYILKKQELLIFSIDRFNLSYLKKSLNFGLKSHLSNILAFLNYRSDIIIISFFLSPVSIGLYSIGVNIAEKLWIIANSVSTVLFPKISSMSKMEDRNILTSKATRLTLLVTLFLCLIIGSISYPLVIVFFGNEFVQSVYILIWLLPGIVIGSATKLMANDFAGRGLPIFNLYVSIITVTINIALNIILVPKYGVIITSIVSSFTYFVNFIIKLWIYKIKFNFPPSNFILITKNDVLYYYQILMKMKRKIM